jgi:hypothetical protein
MPEISTILGDLGLTISPGTVPRLIKNRFHRWQPSDFNANAIARSSAPSASIITQTADAIQSMFDAGVLCEFGDGTYYVDRTIAPANFSTAYTPKNIRFNRTTLRATGSLSSYTDCRDQGTAAILSGASGDDGSNLPAPTTTKVFFDVSNCDYSQYEGNLTLHGGTLGKSGTGLAGMACANSQQLNSQGNVGSVWGGQLIISDFKWGIFGTPRYGQARNFYNGVLVGNIIPRLRLYDNEIHLLMGGNMCDDCFIGELNIIGKNVPGSRGYISTCGLACGTIYMNGPNGTSYCLDIQSTHLLFNTAYAEDDFASPLWVRNGSFVQGTVKMGAGTSTVFANSSFIYADGTSGGGIITIHERGTANGDANKAAVALKSVTSSKRNWTVYSPWAEADMAPFRPVAGTGTRSTDDILISNSRDGQYKWAWGGTAGAPTLSRGASM